MSTVAERLEAELRSLTQPLMAQLREIELEIEVRKTEMEELRAARLKLITIARQIDPELAPKKKRQPSSLVSDEKVAELLEWLRENVNGDEFHASGLAAREGFPFSQSVTSKSLVILHERGSIRLVRRGSGGAKLFKVVA